MNRGATITVALAGNPNVGKSTVFNNLTGLRQHTGNWPGKTVERAQGELEVEYQDHRYRVLLCDLPGTYSLLSLSPEEEIARNYLCLERPDVTVVVADAACLERNLCLCLQVMELSPRTVLCVNLVDEAKARGIQVDGEKLSQLLGIPVCLTSARSGKGLGKLAREMVASALMQGEFRLVPFVCQEEAIEREITTLEQVLQVEYPTCARWVAQRLLEGNDGVLFQLDDEKKHPHFYRDRVVHLAEEGRERLSRQGIDSSQLKDRFVTALVKRAEDIERQVVEKRGDTRARDWKIDAIVTSRRWGYPLMLGMLAVVLWLTIVAANYPSSWLSQFFTWMEGALYQGGSWLGIPQTALSFLTQGVFRTLGWVVSVMLPPLAIFFPLFTFLEDSGYLPRVAFNVDGYFGKAGACGKQSLTMCMGLGCNAVGVTGCRIITSQRQRMIAVLTNSLIPCNGRFPTLITLSTLYMTLGLTGMASSLVGAVWMTGLILLGVGLTFLTSWLLSHTLLRGMSSAFTLELPPYRRPQTGQVLLRSFLDRILAVLGRAVLASIPAGALIWLMAHIQWEGASLLVHCGAFLDPVGQFLGMDGYLLLAFLLGFPANEIVLPIALMCYLSTGEMVSVTDLTLLGQVFSQNGWTTTTAVCAMFFCLAHFPCATTLQTVYRETGKIRWAVLAFLIPLLWGCLLCSVTAHVMAFVM